MSGDERSPKRQRSSYSPASPQYHFAAETKPFVHPPQTPPPSVRMSPSWTGNTTQPLVNQSQSHALGGQTFPSPPSTAGLHSQMREGVPPSSDGSEGSGQQTPAQDIDGRTDGDGDAEMADSTQTDIAAAGDVSMADTKHRRTDHERLAGEGVARMDGAETLYTVPTEPIAASRPHPSRNIVTLYGLDAIRRSVERKDPLTGRKEDRHKLRKSYEGKLKQLGLEGRNKATVILDELTGLLDPEWEFPARNNPPPMTFWEESRIAGMEIGGPHTQNLLSKVDAALAGLAPGQLPADEHRKWSAAIGLDDWSKDCPAKPTPDMPPTKTAALHAVSKTGPHARASAPASPRSAFGRPERAGRKRRYDEASYSGYTEAYNDDDGYSTGGVEDRHSGMSKKRRKDFGSALEAGANMVFVKSA